MALAHSEVIAQTAKWIQETVIGLNLCPFAKPVVLRHQIRYQVSSSLTVENLVEELHLELNYLAGADPTLVDTSFLIFPDALAHFYEFNDFLAVANDVLMKQNLDGVIQIASFHPRYQFANTSADDIENYTNRSPFPMLHFLREKSVEKAIENYPNADSIPDKNIATLKGLTESQVATLLSQLTQK